VPRALTSVAIAFIFIKNLVTKLLVQPEGGLALFWFGLDSGFKVLFTLG
jgi:hypothetical protein